MIQDNAATTRFHSICTRVYTFQTQQQRESIHDGHKTANEKTNSPILKMIYNRWGGKELTKTINFENDEKID